MWCSYVNDPSATPLRVAFAIGKPIGSATKRNLVRRRLRSILHTVSPELNMHHGWLLVGAKPQVVELTFGALYDEVVELLGRVAPKPSPETQP